ncbi:MAG: hypothetical protein A2341_10850 [Deltaproteobacteria bacterium RIFOXYB12_FULL_58_9]|nr:MAG: hypothetical protein A2341_10850 [Deltaproteobacteria bacterium RIFOXYB12_FULL_58_9]
MAEQPGNDQRKSPGGQGHGMRSKSTGGRRRRRRPGKDGPPQKPTIRDAAPLNVSPILDANKTAEEPLTAAEVKELTEHFRFVSKHRKLLRLKPNAAEDRLLNGSQTPEHRGVCMHLLGKIDRATVKSAVDRLENDKDRTDLLAGVVRFSNDPAILLAYLEALSASSSRTEATAALGLGLRRIDFSQVSAAQMRRFLELVVELFEFRDRPQLMLDLLESPTFKSAFDAAAVDMPPVLAELLGPLRAVHAAVFCGETSQDSDPRHLQRGVALLLQGHTATLRSYPEGAKRRLFELGVQGEDFDPKALEVLLGEFPPASREFSSLATFLAREYLRRHDDSRARALLQKLVEHQPGFRLPGRWLAALDAERVGRIALCGNPDDRGWQEGLWLDHQRPALVRKLAAADDTARHTVLLHRRLLVPGVVPLLASEANPGGSGFVALEMVGRPGRWWRQLDKLDRGTVAYEGVAILASILRAGVRLPDSALRRFLIDGNGRLWLFDLDGAALAQPNFDDRAALALACGFCNNILPRSAQGALDSLDSLSALAQFLLLRGRL